MTVPVPSGITAVVERLGEDLSGARITCEHVKDNRWRITAENDRVTMWVEYSAHSRGRLQWQGSRLIIDGRQVERADNYAELVDTFADPDGRGERARVEPVQVEIEDAPEPVQRAFHRIAVTPLARSGEVLLYQAGRRWTVLVDTGAIQLGLHLTTGLMDPTRPLQEPSTAMDADPVTLVVDGVDKSATLNGALDKALAVAAGHDGAPRNPAVAGESAAAVNTGVQVRRRAVIRV